MSDTKWTLIEKLYNQHDRMNCLVDPLGLGFKSETDREREYMEAGALCWQAAEELTRLRGICRTLVDSYDKDKGVYALGELASARINAAKALSDD